MSGQGSTPPKLGSLADGTIETRRREIGEMESMIARLRAKPVAAEAPILPPGGSAAAASGQP